MDETSRRFLLGIAGEDEECHVEEVILAGEMDEASLLEAEDQLIDDYLLGSMTYEEERAFKTHFLHGEERRRKLAFASALIEYARKQPSEKPSMIREPSARGWRMMLSWKRTALLAAAASVVLVTFLGYDELRLRRQTQLASDSQNEMTQLRAELGEQSSESLHPGRRPTVPSSGSQDASHAMTTLELPAATRGFRPSLLRIPGQAQYVRIHLPSALPPAPSYREAVVRESGEEVWAEEFPASALPVSHMSAIVVPSSILPPGLYHLRLETQSLQGRLQQSADWVFRVAKE